MDAVEIPVELVASLRGALMTEMGGLAGDLEQACAAYEKVKKPARFKTVLAGIHACCEMIDMLGWREPDDPSEEEPAAFDLNRRRRGLVVKALCNELASEREFMAEHAEIEGDKHRCEQARRRACAIEGFLAAHDPSEQ